jgi:hypothetical protein
MGKYSKFISTVRRSVPTPKDMVKDGKCVFGTFDKEFETMELLQIKHPTAAPDFLKKFKLTLWEAAEVHLEEGVLLAVVCDMGIFGMNLHVFYDRRKKKVISWVTNLKSRDTVIAPNLLNGAITEAETPSSGLRYVNNFQDGNCHLHGHHQDDVNSIEYEFDLVRLSKPSVVSIPFEDMNVRHRPLYSQKDFFTANGRLTLNGETFHTTDTSTAIIDDHRGYYPRRAHYDWVTTMGVNETDGKREWFAFNLTRNQSIDQDKYNENLIWFKDSTSLLPPVIFTRNPETRDFKDGAVWEIKDEHDMVNITFNVYDIFRMITHAKPIVNIEYFVAFGELKGYVRDEDGKKYILDGMLGMGEDKTLLL